MLLNLVYDSFALLAPQSFRDGMQSAANMLNAAIHDNITVNIAVGYGEFNGLALPGQNFSEGGISQSFSQSYSNLRTLLANHETSNTDVAAVNSLPTTASVNGQSNFFISSAEAKALGVTGASSAIDGIVGMGTSFTGNVLVSGALHEITHAMGRIPGSSILNLYRFTSPGNRLFSGNVPAPASSYFSLDGGVTDLADFGVSSDPSDFLNSSGRTPNDPFNEIVGTLASLTAIDLTTMDVLGFNVTSAPILDDFPANTSTTGQVSVGGFSTGNLEVAGDRDWFRAQLVAGTSYTINLQGSPSGGGTLADPYLRLRDSTGTLLFQNDDTGPGILDSRLTFQPAVSGTYYVEAGAYADAYTGTYTVRLSGLPQIAVGSVVGTGDFAGSGQAGLLYASGGNATIALRSGNGFSLQAVASAHMGAEWTPFGTGDFNNDGKADILWTSASGQAAIWQMNGAVLAKFGIPAGHMGTEWHVAGIADVSGDGNADILWQSSGGDAALWTMNGTNLAGFGIPAGHMGPEWQLAEVGDFSGDHKADALWVTKTGDVSTWLLSGANLVGFDGNVGRMGSEWHVAGAGDVNGDGISDLVWVSTNNSVQIWNMTGGHIGQIFSLNGRNGLEWHFGGIADMTGDGRADLVWTTDAGSSQIWLLNGASVAVLSGNVAAGALGAAGEQSPDAAPSSPQFGFEDIGSEQMFAAAQASAEPSPPASTSPTGGDSGLSLPDAAAISALGLEVKQTHTFS